VVYKECAEIVQKKMNGVKMMRLNKAQVGKVYKKIFFVQLIQGQSSKKIHKQQKVTWPLVNALNSFWFYFIAVVQFPGLRV
jgi:hypothetical protein